MATQVQNRRGSTAEHSTFTGAVGEVTVDTDKEVVVVHDGTTAGGYPQMRENGSNSALALGSAATPSLKFTGDTNTGIYSPGADQVAISTNGTGRLFVDSSGRVGVGTTDPVEKLEVRDGNIGLDSAGTSVGDRTTERFYKRTDNGSTNGMAAIGMNGTGTSGFLGEIKFYTGLSDVFNTSLSERARIDSSGRVGIGTSAPGSLLHLNQSSIGTYFQANASDAIRPLTITSSTTTNTGDTHIFNVSSISGRLGLATNGSTALFIDNSQRVGIGTSSPTGLLTVAATSPVIDWTNSSNTAFKHSIESTGYSGSAAGNTLAFKVASGSGTQATVMTLDGAGRLLVGTSTSRAVSDWAGNGPQGLIQIEAANSGAIMSIISAGTADAQRAGTLSLGRHRNSTVGGTPTVVQSGDALGAICFAGGDGADMLANGASIRCEVDGTPGTDDMPGRLVFSTTTDGASSPTERMRITQAGAVIIGKTTAADNTAGTYTLANGQTGHTVSGDYPLYINRLTNDGTLIRFDQDTVNEGSISVSGTTVSYNGAHLSRWSQLSGIDPHDKDQRPEILRGTVMSNLDEMCEWIDPETGEPQVNEQLNKTKISDVEGDKDVAGIFQDWDDDDDTWVNDFYLAMTGDFIIRIAAGVTVKRGDLLMSAGDGTAKPQDDDIIRSKTIAKVTSTNVSCTYDDGSYCVPCVLMAC